MNMENRFDYLLQKFLAKEASLNEEEELKKLILSDQYEESIRQSIAHFMNQEDDVFQHSKNPPLTANELLQTIKQKSGRRDKKSTRNWRLWIQVAAMLTLLAGIGVWIGSYKQFSKSDVALIESEPELGHDSIVVFRKKEFIRLPDGSSVLLNDHSELSYRLPFGRHSREVNLKGEAFFEVTSNKAKPFVVKTGRISTKVLGTAFNVNSQEENVVVTVKHGLVEVADDAKNLSLVRPNERLAVNASNGAFSKKEVAVEEEVKWKETSLVFDNLSLREVAGLLERHFQIKLMLTNPALDNCRISAWFLNNENLDEILEMVYGTRQASHSIRDNVVTISGGIPCD
jgi:transmembrane sensor